MKKLSIAIASAAMMLAHGAALAQTNFGFYQGFVPTPAQWNYYFGYKQDVIPYPTLNKRGDTMLGPLVTAPSASGGAGFNIPAGSAPSAPNAGDVWNTGTGLYAYIGGKTVQLGQPVGRLAVSVNVNFNSANTDTQVPIALPPGFTRWIADAVRISGASASLTTATGGLFTQASGAGTAIVTGGSTITVSQTAAETNGNAMSFTVNNSNTESYTAANVYFRVGTAEGSAATGNVTVVYTPLP